MANRTVLARLRPRKPSPAMVVALLALVIACSGTAVAAGVLITSSSQIGRGVITGNNIHSRTITGKLIQRGSLGSDALTPDAVRALASSGTTGLEWYRVAGPENQPAAGSSRVMTITNVPPGVYAIFSHTILTDLEPPSPGVFASATVADGHCQLSAGGQVVQGRAPIGTSFGNTPSDIVDQTTQTFTGPGSITLDCDAQAKWRASDSSIIAIRLGNSPVTQLTG